MRPPLVTTIVVMVVLAAGCAGMLDDDERGTRPAPPPPVTTRQTAPTRSTTLELTIGQRQAMGTLAADVYELAELECQDLSALLADRSEALSLRLSAESIADTLQSVGLETRQAVAVSRLKPPPPGTRAEVEEWCRLWKITVRALGDYLIGVAERGRG